MSTTKTITSTSNTTPYFVDATQPPPNVVNLPSVWTIPTIQGNDMFSSTTDKIIPALLRAKWNMGAAIKDSTNPFFKSKYADLNSVKAACEPALAAEKIAVFQPTVQKDGKNYVRTLLVHDSGQTFQADTEIVCLKANDPQALGSSITYARRYGLQSLVGLGAEDDDGNLGSGKTETPAKNAPARGSFRKPTTTPEVKTGSNTGDGLEGWK